MKKIFGSFSTIIRRVKHNINYKKKNIFIVLLYHRVIENYNNNQDDYLGTIISKKIFLDQLNYLKLHYNIISFDELFNYKNTKNKKINLLITFDDCYVDSYNIVFPILREMKIKASFFASTNYLNAFKPIWDLDIFNALNSNNNNFILQEKKIGINLERSKFKNNIEFIKYLIKILKFNNKKSNIRIINEIFDKLKYKRDNLELNRCLNTAEIQEMSSHNMEFGSHGESHLSFSTMNENESFNEMKNSKNKIENITGKKCNFLAFPFGSSADFNQSNIETAKKVGFKHCLLNIHGVNMYDNYAFKRIIMHQKKDLKYILG